LDKSPDAFRTISEVGDDLQIPQHVLRFWESRFPQIKPMKRAGGRRYYRPDDVELLRGIRHLLYGEGYTIRGVQRILREQGPRFVQMVWQPGAAQPAEQPEDDASDVSGNADNVATNAPARTLFGLLKAPPLLSDPEGGIAERGAKPQSSEPRLTLDHVRRLQSALDEMRECRQIIDQALKDDVA
jgi:DNA-binding transcriptional MerR regulator